MKTFVPEKKMSKKARKERAKEKRQLWTTDPRPRIVESRKVYSRKRDAHEGRDDPEGAFFCGFFMSCGMDWEALKKQGDWYKIAC